MSQLSISLASEVVGHIGSFAIRNTMLMAWLAMMAMIIGALAMRLVGYRLQPGRMQTALEMGFEALYGLFGSILHEDRLTRRFFPMLATMFLFIVLGNWMGILPGVGSITILTSHEGKEVTVPLFRSMNADVNMTLAIALVSMIAVQMYGMAELGVKKYSGKFLVPPWKNPIGTFVGLLEFVSEISKLVSFTFRLFGNIFAGEVLLIVISFLIPYLIPVPFLGMELFVGLIQALVFAMLTTVFLKGAITEHEAHAAEHHPSPA
jgi:F-type H+-transporting ATPase subunit a